MDVTIFARTKASLDNAHAEIMNARLRQDQHIASVSVDLSNAAEVSCSHLTRTCLVYGLNPLQVDLAIRNCRALPDFAYCVAGGSASEMGFFADLSAAQLERCLKNNYLSAMYFSHSCLKLWLDEQVVKPTRHIVFVSSTAAFVGCPGYAAYTPTKAAVRALADTLRQEMLLYGGTDRFQVHCSFPGTFVSDGFILEQRNKPQLTKILEGVDDTIEHLQKTKQSTAEVATHILEGVNRGDFLIVHDLEGALLLNNMRGPSPRDRGLWDVALSCIAPLVWAFYRRMIDRKTREYGRKIERINSSR